VLEKVKDLGQSLIKRLNSITKKHYQMKTLAEDLNNIAVLNEEELSKIIGGTTSTSGVEDEDIWM
jgi:bacteriocin-like protein